MFWRQVQSTGQLRTVFSTSFSYLTKSPVSSKTIVAQSVLTPISINWTVAHGAFDKLQLFNKSNQFQAKRQLRRVFWRHFQSTGQLHRMFSTSYRFLTIVANFKQNDSCAECFDATFNQLDSCARCFRQALAFQQKSPISSKTKVAQSVLTPLLINWTVAQDVFDKLSLFNNSRKFQAKRQLRRVFWRKF